jgi:uncharacterized membrane protein (UPF0182 family)
MQLPGEKGQEFVLQRSFTPRGKGGILRAFVFARTDGDNYGKMVVHEVADPSAQSPGQAATLIESDQFIGSRFTLLDQAKSHVIRGDVQLIPIGGAVLYLRPIWILGEGTQTFPRFSFVAAAVGDQAVLGYDVKDVVDTLIEGPNAQTRYEREVASGRATTPGTAPVNPPANGSSTTTVPTTPGTGTQPPPNATADELLQAAVREFDAADAALARGDLGEYQRRNEAGEALVRRANQAGSSTTTTPATNP